MTTDLHVDAGAAVRLTGLRKSFGAVTAVDGVDLTVAPGEVVALLGPNGAGKTTTIELVLGLRDADAGSATVFGLTPTAAIRSGRVGAMMQSGGLLHDLKVRETVALVAAMHEHPLSVEAALELAGITDLAGRKVETLSGGQRQRVLFALAVVPDPSLVVLDEPTVAMDVESRRAFWASMRHLTDGGRSVLFATHYLEEADQNADRIVLMAAGRVVADGPATEIKATVDVRRIRATLPGADLEALGRLPGVGSVQAHGGTVTLTCDDADAALRALLASEPAARDFEVTGAGLEDAFLALTGTAGTTTSARTTTTTTTTTSRSTSRSTAGRGDLR
jgi:ABC-2 type transport system ATP-binding protein